MPLDRDSLPSSWEASFGILPGWSGALARVVDDVPRLPSVLRSMSVSWNSTSQPDREDRNLFDSFAARA
jgi:hypothetical protein